MRFTVACAQVEPVIFDRDATVAKLAQTAAEAATKGARVVVFPEAVVPAYPSSVWAKALAGWAEDGATEAFALLAREAVEVPGPAERRLGEIAREHEPARRADLPGELHAARPLRAVRGGRGAVRRLEERQRFDPVGRYHRPDVLGFELRAAR